MSRRLDCQLAAGEAEALVRRLNLTTLPIDPFEIAHRHGIDVKAKPPRAPGVSGFLLRVGDKFAIMYGAHIQNDGFIRFTVAHELGHYFLPGHPDSLFAQGEGLHQSRSGFISRNKHEEEADHFAAALLMPEDLFRPALNEAGIGFEAIEQLAALCRTSITATSIRYATYSPDAVAVIVSTGSTIDYCFMSDVLRSIRGIERIRKGDSVPGNSETRRFNSDRSRIAGGERAQAWTSLDLWFDGAPEIEMKEDVVGLGTYGKTLTVLFSDEAIEEEEPDED